MQPTISGGSGAMIKAVVFDLDGTLIDSAEDLCSALNRLLAEEGRRGLAFGRGRADDRRRRGEARRARLWGAWLVFTQPA
jgi:phosphoglycolate phosphatase-like HAD superfamily hydrolase